MSSDLAHLLPDDHHRKRRGGKSRLAERIASALAGRPSRRPPHLLPCRLPRARLEVFGPSPHQRASLAPQGILDAANGMLNSALDLVEDAFALELLVAR